MSYSKGFTLMEVLVALAILAISMTAVVQTAATTANQQAYLEEKTLSHWVALNQLALQRLSVQPMNSKGEVTMASRQWHWDMQETKSNGRLLSVEMHVSRSDRPNDRLATLSSVIYTPKTP